MGKKKGKRAVALWVNLKRGIKPNGWSGSATRSKSIARLKPRSKAYAARMSIYRRLVKVFLSRNKYCAVCRMRQATEVHHFAGRAGKLLLEEKLWEPVCRKCHRSIHENPAEARRLGLLAQPGQWNKQPDTPPRDAETERLRELIRNAT